MAALARMPVNPVLEQAGLLDMPAPIAERLDPRSFVVVQSREEAEYLMVLDHSNGVDDSVWTAFFVESLVEFLVWQNHPCGKVSESDLDWFVGMVADAASPSVPALLFALVRELNDVPERLMALAMQYSKNRLKALH